MKKCILTAIIVVFSYYFGLAQTTDQEGVKVGDKAPPLHIAKWLRGDPVSEFKNEDPNVYVVYFTGTWCPPCLKSIPHLTDLQKKYADEITLISVYMEYQDSDDANIKGVRKLMERLGDKMDFTIAVDVPQSSRTTWGLLGPAMFIVRSGEVIWCGSPSGLAPVLEQIVTGTFRIEGAQQEQQIFNERFNNIRKAKEDGDFHSALSGIDSLIERAHDGRKPMLYYEKFKILAGNDDKAAYAWLQWLLDSKIEGIDWIHLVTDFNRILKENRDYETELEVFDRTIETAEVEGFRISAIFNKADTYAKKGDYQKAVDLCQKIINQLDKNSDNECNVYYSSLAVYTYKLLTNEDTKKANTWLQDRLQNVCISRSLVEAVVEVVTASPSQKNIRLAHELIDRAIREEKGPYMLPFLWSQKAAVYTVGGEYLLAHKWIDKALQKSSSSSYLAHKAFVYAASGAFDKAIDLCRKAIELNEDQVIAAHPLNKSLYLDNKKKYEKQLAGYKNRN